MLASAITVVVAMIITIAVSKKTGRIDIVDTTWGLGFAAIAVVSFAVSGGGNWPLTLCTVVWGVRLGVHLHRRNHGRPEDPRYGDIIAAAPGNVDVHLITRVYLPQALVMWFVSLPVQWGQFGAWRWWSWIGLGIWAVGFLFETVGDAQLARFRRDSANAGAVLDTGLWRYTRHPNYFGDACLWWGLYVMAAVTPWAASTVLSPIAMTWTLAKGTGKPLLEKDIAQRRPSYVDYIRRTSGFIPLPPKKNLEREDMS